MDPAQKKTALGMIPTASNTDGEGAAFAFFFKPVAPQGNSSVQEAGKVDRWTPKAAAAQAR